MFRTTRALLHDRDRPPVDPDRVEAEWRLMHHWLDHDSATADVCGFRNEDLSWVRRERRIVDLRRQVASDGRFTVSAAEMAFWVRFAWMSADRCSGRQHALQAAVIRWLPDVTTGAGMLRAAVDHADLAMAAKLAPQTVITVLGEPTPPGQLGPMFATEQVVRFAGWRRVDGSWLGDGAYRSLTWWLQDADETLIVTDGLPGPYDVLPMVAVGAAGDVAVGTCPPSSQYLVDIPRPRHPDDDTEHDLSDTFARWHITPLQTNFDLDIAGQRYCVLFNGWYVDEEIAIDLLDPERYDLTARAAQAIYGRPVRLSEHRLDQIDWAVIYAVRAGFKAARARANRLDASQDAFAKFRDRYRAEHGEEPPNDPVWTANRMGSRYRRPTHSDAARAPTPRRSPRQALAHAPIHPRSAPTWRPST